MASPTDDLDSLCRRLARLSMINGFEKAPYLWQENVISHLNKMACHPSRGGLEPSPVFLCHPTTGGGKSLVRDTFAVAQGGVTWCLSPLLSLAADQETKINAGSNTTITAIHIDAYRSPAAQKLLCDHIMALSLSSPNTTIILSSPQAIVHNSIYQSMLNTLIKKRLLILLAIDEIHLFVQFGQYF
jgi:superfamily II DNA helicase RecQ